MSARNGSRIFRFRVTTEARIDAMASVEIPAEFLVGVNRVPLQDCAGISLAKLQHTMEDGTGELPKRLRLSASDISEFSKPSARR
jgi:hypothetical protein